MNWFGLNWFGLNWFVLVCFFRCFKVLFGLVLLTLVCFGWFWFFFVWSICFDWIGCVWFCFVWSFGLVEFGMLCLHLVCFGCFGFGLVGLDFGFNKFVLIGLVEYDWVEFGLG